MYRNKATLEGTIFWLYNSEEDKEPLGLSSLVYEENESDGYGPLYATQPILASVDQLYNVSVYNAPMTFPVNATFYDYYGQLASSEFSYNVRMSISNFDCSEEVGALKVGFAVLSTLGLATFSELISNCYPGITKLN